MQIRTASNLRSWYLHWKALRLPFRSKILVGMDLEENTFWEFVNKNKFARPRRIVELYNSRMSYVDYELPPQWSQWLRHARQDPPSIEELENEELRIASINERVRQAQSRWESRPLKTHSSVAPGSVSPQGMPGMSMVHDTTDSRPSQDTSQQSKVPKDHESHSIMHDSKHSSVASNFEPEAWNKPPVKR
ncbi:uncharacterized protein V1516DRAFT_663876 [Lipomyces oligophaga]|uniref:uncharacterized protein n=1 Tax=Lipomyces oligophaga TaxID=45792 RepID=UPI0034CDD869